MRVKIFFEDKSSEIIQLRADYDKLKEEIFKEKMIQFAKEMYNKKMTTYVVLDKKA